MIATNAATNLLAFIIVLGFLIFAHEAGHFMFAKLFRVRVLVFSFGFGKRLFGFQRGDTDYRVSLVPLGGYVRMAGDAPDETHKGEPDEYLSRPKWQRFLILVAGPGMNILIAIVFLAILLMVGIPVPKIDPVIGTVLPGKPAEHAGLKAGDRVLAANGDPIRSFEELKLAIAINPETPLRLTLLRNGQRVEITVVPERQMTDYGTTGIAGFQPFIEPIVGAIAPNSPAAKAGLQAGDRIVAVNGQKVTQLDDLDPAIAAAEKTPLALTILRGGQTLNFTIAPNTAKQPTYPGFTIPTTMRRYGFAGAFRESVRQNWRMVRYTFYVIGRLFRARGSVKDFTGPISIARISGEMLRTGWKELLSLMAAISLQLGIMNLLPIPVLDGGHIAVLGVEGVARRELSIRTKERIQQLGFAVLAALMIVVLYNDVLQNIMLLRRG
jgi:regulator of sigma E protease